MNGPSMLDALEQLRLSDAPRQALRIEASWFVDADGRQHSEAHELDGLTPVQGDLETFLAAKKCNRRICKSVLGIFGTAGALSGALAQAYIEAERELQRATGYQETRRIGRWAERHLEPLSKLVVKHPDAVELVEQYTDHLRERFHATQAEYLLELRSPNSVAALVEEHIDLLIQSNHTPFASVNMLLHSRVPGQSFGSWAGYGHAASTTVASLGDVERVGARLGTLVPESLIQVAVAAAARTPGTPITVTDGEDLIVALTELWREAIRKELDAIPARYEALREQYRRDARCFLQYRTRPRGVHRHSEAARANELTGAFGWAPGRHLLLLPGAVGAYAAQEEPDAVIEIDRNEATSAVLEICETLLDEDVESNLDIRLAWEMARRLA